jgi:hypothetical protein
MAPLLMIGCGGEKVPATYAVTGNVTFEGKPLEGADVVLVPTNPTDPAAKSAGAVTDSQGNFSVKTYWAADRQLDGALPGDYGIAVTKLEKRDVPPDKKPEEVMALHMQLGPPKSLLPAKYGAPTTSGFKVTVGKASPEPLKLELQ